MADRHIKAEYNGYSKEQAAKALFPGVLNRRFWWGFAAGVVLMSLFNIGDVHFCVGECDAIGVRILGVFE